MACLQEQFLERIESFADRVIHVATALEERSLSRRIVDQVLASGTSVGANIFEADEAMTRADFVKSLCIAIKELNETRFWLRLASRHNWIKQDRLSDLIQESTELRKILGTMVSRTKKHPRKNQ